LIWNETTKKGPKYLAAQLSLWLGTALLKSKNYTNAKELLQSTLVQAEKLVLLAVRAQAHAFLAKVYVQEKNAAEAEREKKLAMQFVPGDSDRSAFRSAHAARFCFLTKPLARSFDRS
jgi:Tfp pilus assembly protein PilF